MTYFFLFIFRILAKFGTQYYVLQIYKEREGLGYSDAFRGNYNGWEWVAFHPHKMKQKNDTKFNN